MKESVLLIKIILLTVKQVETRITVEDRHCLLSGGQEWYLSDHFTFGISRVPGEGRERGLAFVVLILGMN